MGLCASEEPPLTAEQAAAKIPAELRQTYTDAGQEHVFKFADEGKLSCSQLEALVAQLSSLDVVRVNNVYQEAIAFEQAVKDQSAEAPQLEPLPEECCGNVSTMEPAERDGYEAVAYEAVRKGEVAALVLAGGAGTRLGFQFPKGMFSIGLPSGKSLFELFADRLRMVAQLAGSDKLIPWFVMTSEGDNHEQTAQFFKTNKYFGYTEDGEPCVHFFSQGTLPCLTEEGKIMLETGFRVGKAADGNGGIYAALQQTKQLELMRSTGVKYVHCFSVDNAISKVGDPVFVGYCISKQAELGNKVVWKAEPGEKVGVVGKRGGKFAVIEYTEMKEEDTLKMDGNGKLLYGAGNVCNHFYTVDFLQGVQDKDLVFHVARKKIKTPAEDGQTALTPDENTGIKLESFIFDCFNKTDKMAVLEGPRESEFSPVKNPVGSAKDSPDSARAMLTAQSVAWLTAAGCTVTPGPGQLEVCPWVSYRGEGLQGFSGLSVDCSTDVYLHVPAPQAALTAAQAEALLAEAKGSGKSTLADGGDKISRTD
eukprot:TRINITY_DN11852_c0_g1_i1.p1 TRINITY_DN11852_c0_g1~~TRINITY_DN11852_c0_g1_i1.p1  ORF type:complete len:535 (+),score=203.42 TRINITY_DN11852_c0_g1_i1:128-1732(+)